MKEQHQNTEYIIYRAVNNTNNQTYIGATTSSIHQRKLDHIERANRRSQNKFHEAISTYGVEAFNWEQIDTAQSLNELAKKEKQYVLEYNTLEGGYNSDCGGGLQKNVYQYDMERGNLVGVYDSLESASNAVNSSRKSISNACLGYNKSCRGFLWSYNKTEDFERTIDLRKKIVGQYSFKGILLGEYSSVSEASRMTGISKTCIARCCREERNQSAGFVWKYL